MTRKGWTLDRCPACKRPFETHERSPAEDALTRFVCRNGTVVYHCRTCQLVIDPTGHHVCKTA